jgi:acetolactate synthase-1/2/3 large subunit
MYGAGAYQSSDLAETNYAKVAEAMGCVGIRVEKPDALASAFRKGLEPAGVPVVIDVVVTRDPARMLPAVDNRTVTVKKGDRVA